MKMIQYNTITTHNKKQIIQTRNVIAFIMPQNMKKKLEKSYLDQNIFAHRINLDTI